MCASTPGPEAGAQCGSAARWELHGGPPARVVPTVIHRDKSIFRDRVIAFEPDPPLSGRTPNPVCVPVLRLHCPKNRGCLASEEYAVQSGTTVEASLTLTPVGGGRVGTSTSIRLSSRWTTADGVCLQYLLPAEIWTEFGTLVYKGKRLEDMGLIGQQRIQFLEGMGRQEAIPEVDDGCQQPADAIEGERYLTNREEIKAGERDYSFYAVSAARGTLNLGVAAPGWPALSFKYERTVTTSFTRSTKLVSGTTYLAYTPEPPADLARPEHAEILWTTV